MCNILCDYVCVFYVQVVDEGKYVESDYYFDHVEKSSKPCQILLVTDRYLFIPLFGVF